MHAASAFGINLSEKATETEKIKIIEKIAIKKQRNIR